MRLRILVLRRPWFAFMGLPGFAAFWELRLSGVSRWLTSACSGPVRLRRKFLFRRLSRRSLYSQISQDVCILIGQPFVFIFHLVIVFLVAFSVWSWTPLSCYSLEIFCRQQQFLQSLFILVRGLCLLLCCLLRSAQSPTEFPLQDSAFLREKCSFWFTFILWFMMHSELLFSCLFPCPFCNYCPRLFFSNRLLSSRRSIYVLVLFGP